MNKIYATSLGFAILSCGSMRAVGEKVVLGVAALLLPTPTDVDSPKLPSHLMPPTADKLRATAANNCYLAKEDDGGKATLPIGTSTVPPNQNLPTEALPLKTAVTKSMPVCNPLTTEAATLPVLVHGLTTKTTSAKNHTRNNHRAKKQKALRRPPDKQLPTHRNHGQTDRSPQQRPHTRK